MNMKILEKWYDLTDPCNSRPKSLSNFKLAEQLTIFPSFQLLEGFWIEKLPSYELQMAVYDLGNLDHLCVCFSLKFLEKVGSLIA